MKYVFVQSRWRMTPNGVEIDRIKSDGFGGEYSSFSEAGAACPPPSWNVPYHVTPWACVYTPWPEDEWVKFRNSPEGMAKQVPPELTVQSPEHED